MISNRDIFDALDVSYGLPSRTRPEMKEKSAHVTNVQAVG